MAVSTPRDQKEPWRVAAGKEGARRRWGDTPRRIRVDELHPADRDAILAILAARRNADAAAETK